MERSLSYVDAIREALAQEMQRDPAVVLFGLDVDDPKAILGTTRDLAAKFGPERVFGTPLSEDAMVGAAIGMALGGLRPVHVHIRMDFLMLAMNQLINMAAKTHYMFGGQEHVPMVVRSIIGRSWGQGAQHSQALHAMFMHVPGIKVVAPATPYDAKGCLLEAIRDNNPVMFIEHRILYYQKGFVPEGDYGVAPGRARIAVPGKHVTVVGISHMQLECLRAQRHLQDVDVQAEVIDPIWLSPLDIDTIAASAQRTGHLLVVDNGWTACGASAEILAAVGERHPGVTLKRMGFAPVPCPTSPPLEALFYPSAEAIAASAYALLGANTGAGRWLPKPRQDLKDIEFKGPF
jgi:pyruvate/2-oxoglutarate/acetoin dehydrogenase E1 component